MTDRNHDFELQKRYLDDHWVEVRIVYHTMLDRQPDYHARGLDARVRIAEFVLTFAAGVADTLHAKILARELTRLRDHIAVHSKGCPEDTRH